VESRSWIFVQPDHRRSAWEDAAIRRSSVAGCSTYFGHTKLSGRRVLRKGLSPLATTISTDGGAPVVAGIRLRAGKAGSGKGAASMVREAIRTARAAGAVGEILVRGDSAYGSHAVVGGCVRAGARFSVALTKNPAVSRAIAGIPDAWTPVHHPGAVVDPDTGELISDAEAAEVGFTAFATTRHPGHRAAGGARVPRPRPHRRAVPGVAVPPVVHRQRRVDRRRRHHPPPARHHRDRVRRPDRRAVGAHAFWPLSANGAWASCAAITHNLLRATGTLSSTKHAVARGATLRRHLVTVPARLARPRRRRVLHLPAHWPWATPWMTLWDAVLGTGPPVAA
jgi:hypothetical protein